MSAPLLAARGVCAGYHGDGQILNDVTFETFPGFTSLVGPNGAGKTTLLRTLAGLILPSQGTVELDGRPLSSFSSKERARNIALVAQHARIDYDFSVLDIVLMGRTPWKGLMERDSAQDLQIARASLQRTNALQFQRRLMTQLSGGEQQRVMIARALCQQTGILLLDEPVSALDLKHQTEILNTVRQAAAGGLACVCVLHDLNLASHYSDRICLMREGRIVSSGAPRDILRKDILEEVYETSIRILHDEQDILVLPDMHLPARDRVSSDDVSPLRK